MWGRGSVGWGGLGLRVSCEGSVGWEGRVEGGRLFKECEVLRVLLRGCWWYGGAIIGQI